MMRETPFETIEELEAYTGEPQIQCLECGKWFKSLATHLPRIHGINHDDYRQKWGIPRRFALAGTATREKLSEQMHVYIETGQLTHDHLDSAVEAARAAGRGQKAPVDVKRQSEMTAAIRPGDRFLLPPGAKRADGRNADRARQYQQQRRGQTKPKWVESPERRKEAHEAWLALQAGDPMPLFRYTIRYDTYIQFTPDEDEIIRQHYPDWGALRVGMLLKRKPESIRSRAQVLGVPNKSPQAKSHSYRWDQSNDSRLIEMVKNRNTQKEIAKHFGTSVTTIAAQVKRLKVKKPRA